MNKPIFYKTRITEKMAKDIRYTPNYIEYIIANHIYHNHLNKGISFESLYSYLGNIYDFSVFKKSGLNELIHNNFNVNEVIRLSESQSDALISLYTFRENLKKYKKMSEYNLSIKLLDNIISGRENFIENISLITLLDKEKDDLSYVRTNSNFFNVFKKINERPYIDLYYQGLTNIHLDYHYVFINNLFYNETLREILYLLNVYYIKDLFKFKRKDIFSLLILIDFDWIALCNILKRPAKNIFISYASELKNNLSEREYNVVNFRLGYKKPKTLEELGSFYNITRERVRQIEKKLLNSLENKISNVDAVEIVINAIIGKILPSNKNYLTVYDLFEYFQEEDIVTMICFLLQVLNTDYVFNQKYNIIFNNENIIEELIDETINKLGDVVTWEVYSNLDFFSKKIVREYYRDVGKNTFLKRTLNLSELYLLIVKENFNEIRPNNAEDIEKFNKILKQYYNGVPPLHDRAFAGFIDRYPFILVDRGTYKWHKSCVKINDDLLNKILIFIKNNGPIVYYANIFENFKKELENIGVNNRYYLKGLIDSHELFENLNTKKDFLSTDELLTSSYDAAISYSKTFDKDFSARDIHDKFSGISIERIKTILYYELNKNLLSLSNSRYIYLDNINISREDKESIREIIENTFIELNSEIISVDKLYAKIFLAYPHILENLKYIDSSFALFSLLEKTHPDYNYYRPLLSKTSNKNMTTMGLIVDYIKDLDQFNIKMINDYCNNMNIAQIGNTTEFIDKVSNDFVQIDVDTMIKKEKLNISDFQLNEIKKVLDLILNNYEEINTKHFEGYVVLPKLLIAWNKYLLVGIIKTYLSNYFKIEYTDRYYHITDFIIRRIENE